MFEYLGSGGDNTLSIAILLHQAKGCVISKFQHTPFGILIESHNEGKVFI